MQTFDSSSDFQPATGLHNPELQQALRAEKMAPSAQTRANLLRTLSKATILLAVRELPPHLRGAGNHVLEEATSLVFLSSTNPQGQSMAIFFSDHQQVQARKPGAQSIGMSATSAAQYFLMNDYQEVVLDPAGDWVELTRQEVEQMARGNAD